MNTDLTFISNEKDKNLSDRFRVLIKDTKFFDEGASLELYQKPLSEIPIKKISEGEQKPFIEIVDKILAVTGSNVT
ncbi:hypothetical protein HY612_03740 [Candidatus Roizmanbacteria bacterium]|nr:hypothetical protein [Candidatus Roizmanbacteria bacterium]